jgi:transcription-repair coupling factor (superfamily II helicase)
VLVASWTDGSVERMGGVLSDHGVTPIRKVKHWPEALKLDASAFGIACLGIERGFEAPDFVILVGAGCAGRPHGAGARPRAPGAEFHRRSLVADARAIWSPTSNMAWGVISA